MCRRRPLPSCLQRHRERAGCSFEPDAVIVSGSRVEDQSYEQHLEDQCDQCVGDVVRAEAVCRDLGNGEGKRNYGDNAGDDVAPFLLVGNAVCPGDAGEFQRQHEVGEDNGEYGVQVQQHGCVYERLWLRLVDPTGRHGFSLPRLGPKE